MFILIGVSTLSIFLSTLVFMGFLTGALTKVKANADLAGSLLGLAADPFHNRTWDQALSFMIDRVLEFPKMPKNIKWYLTTPETAYYAPFRNGLAALLLGTVIKEVEKGDEGVTLPVVGKIGNAIAKFGVGSLLGVAGGLALWHPNHNGTGSTSGTSSASLSGNLYV